MLADLFCVVPGYSWDLSRKVSLLRKPCKFHWINLLAAVAWSPENIRSIHDFENLAPSLQGRWWGWLVAQELWRREALTNPEPLTSIDYWQGNSHEVDFVTKNEWIEVKRGSVSPFEFSWFNHLFSSQTQLRVICSNKFETERTKGVNWEEFLEEIDR